MNDHATPDVATAISDAVTVEVDVDAVVVGAGISGLAVAQGLLAAGRSVAVLESRDRVGGRLLSPELSDGTGRVDLGATWFWPGEERVAALVDELGIAVHRQYLDGDAVFHQPSGSQRIEGNPIDVPSFRFADGAQSLAEGLATSLPDDLIEFEARVIRVSASDVCEIQHTGGTLTARHVVLALPPALAVSQIEFAPALPDRLAGLAALTPVWMGSTVKVVAHFDHAFWRNEGLAGSAVSHIGPMRELHDMSGPDGQPAAIFGFVPNNSPSPAPTEEAIRHQLVEMFGPAAADPIQIIIADWRSEAATSPPGVEQLQAYQAFGHDLFQRPALDGRLHWTSTETATVAPGHIEGALAAAERVVAAILSSDPAQPDSAQPAPTSANADPTALEGANQ